MISFRSHQTGVGCRHQNVDLDPEGRIKAAVGARGGNNPRDVRTVQSLLNGIGPLEGGPPEMLAVDGIVGPITLGAINAFQTFHLGSNDGRVDVDGRTIRLLREPPGSVPIVGDGGDKTRQLTQLLGGGGAAPAFNPPSKKDPLPKPPGNFNKQEIYAKRLISALSAWPTAKSSVDKILQRVSIAISLAQRPTLRGGGDALIAYFDKHFKTGVKHGDGLANDLRAIEHVYRMMNVVMAARSGYFGGTPWGVYIFDIDRFPNLNKNAGAYTGLGAMHIPSNKVDRRYNHPMMGATVYLCDGVDSITNDQWINVVMHEIAHMAGSTRTGAGIDDFGYAHQVKKFAALGKWHRMHNADNYSMCALEMMIGTPRVVASTANNDFLTAPVVDAGVLKN